MTHPSNNPAEIQDIRLEIGKMYLRVAEVIEPEVNSYLIAALNDLNKAQERLGNALIALSRSRIG